MKKKTKEEVTSRFGLPGKRDGEFAGGKKKMTGSERDVLRRQGDKRGRRGEGGLDGLSFDLAGRHLNIWEEKQVPFIKNYWPTCNHQR